MGLLTMIKTIYTDGLHKRGDGVAERVCVQFYVEIDRETNVITQNRCTEAFSCTLWIYGSSQATCSNAEIRAAVFAASPRSDML